VLTEEECPIVGDVVVVEVDRRSQEVASVGAERASVGQLIGEEDRWQRQ